MARDPFCSACGYSLVGVTESSRCPECGRPLVEVLERGPVVRHGRRWESPQRLFGKPLIHIALGPHENERIGRARGIIAIGDEALGWIAIGAFARGFIAIGALSLGIVSLGSLSVGLLAAGGLGVGGYALGGGAFGAIATGGGAVGLVAQGGGAFGYYAEGGGAGGRFVISAIRRDPEAVAFFASFNRLLGGGPLATGPAMLTRVGWYFVGLVVVAAPLVAAILYGLWRERRSAAA